MVVLGSRLAALIMVGMVLGCSPHENKGDEAAHKAETHGHADEHSHEEHKHEAHEHEQEKQGHGEHGHDDEHQDQVELSPEQVKLAELEILTAGSANIADEVLLQGEIQVEPNSEAVVLSPVAGIVTSAPVNLGQAVKAGAVLAVLESRELAELKRNYLEARERAQLADSRFQREVKLRQAQLGTEQGYVDAQSAKTEAEISVAGSRAILLSFGLSTADLNSLSLAQPANLARLVLRAPRSGHITSRSLAVGQRVTPDTSLLTIADLNKLAAVLSASSTQLEGIQLGQSARVSLATGNTSGVGRVQFLSPQLNENSRSAAVYVALDNASLWRPGQFVKAWVTRHKTTVAVAVSTEALQTSGADTVVYVKNGNQFEAKPVTVGRQDAIHAEIVAGLAAGQAYVAKNSFVLKADLGKSSAEHTH